jgi:uncharacterized membrane protein YvbJ
MTFCPHCGTQLSDKPNYCSKCGKPLLQESREEFTVSADDLVKTIKKLIHEGNVTRIIIKDEQKKILLDIPITIGFAGFIIAPWLAALGVIAAMVTNCTIVVIRKK